MSSNINLFNFYFLLFFKDLIYLFLERGERREKEGEKLWSVAPRTPPTGDPACSPGMCPDWDQTYNLLLCRPALNPLSHSSRGWFLFLLQNCEYIFVCFSCWFSFFPQQKTWLMKGLFVFFILTSSVPCTPCLVWHNSCLINVRRKIETSLIQVRGIFKKNSTWTLFNILFKISWNINSFS